MQQIHEIQQSIYQRLRRMSIKKQMILSFSITTFLTILIAIIIIQIQVNNLKSNTEQTLNSSTNNNLQTQQALSAIKYSCLSTLFSFSLKISQLLQVYNYFTNNQDIYKSYESNTSNGPILTINCPNISNYAIPAMYIYKDNYLQSIFYNHSFFDVMLPTLFLNNYNTVKRINIIYFNPLNFNQTLIRTLPATNNFQILNMTNLAYLQNSTTFGQINITGPYIDQYSQNSTEQLFSIVTQFPSTNFTLIFQIELYFSDVGDILLNDSIFYTGTQYLFLINNTTGTYILYSSLNSLTNIKYQSLSQLQSFLQSSNKYMIDMTNITNQFKNANYSDLSSNPGGTFTIVQLTSLQSITSAENLLFSFLENQNLVITSSFFLTGILAFVTVVTFAYNGANLITKPLKKTQKALNKYFEGVDMSLVLTKLRSFPSHGKIKKLVETVQALLDKLEQEKDNYRNINYSDEKPNYPKNELDKEFLQRVNHQAQETWANARFELAQKYKKFE